MKKRIWSVALSLLLILALIPLLSSRAEAAGSVTINSTNFPDANFRSYVSSRFDSNSDGVLSESELAAVKGLYVDNQNISSLDGVEFFTELKTLSCGGNSFSTLWLDKNTALEQLYCYNCPNLSALYLNGHSSLKGLYVYNDTSMTSLQCFNCSLTNLNVIGCSALKYLYCYGNQLTALDLTGCTNLGTLYCSDNPMTSLDVSGLTKLERLNCRDCGLTSLKTDGCTALEELCCSGNALTKLDVSGLGSLKSLDTSDCTDLKILHCSRCALTKLDVIGCTALTDISAYDNDLTSVNVSHNTALDYLDLDDNRLAVLDVSDNTALTSLFCSGNQLTTLNIDKNKALKVLYCRENLMTTLSVTGHAALKDLRAGGNTKLERLYCADCALTSLEISDCTALEELSCYYNALTSLDLSGCTALKTLDAEGNDLTSVILSDCAALETLDVDTNNLTELDLSACTSLKRLECCFNVLTSLDLSHNTSLKSLHCFYCGVDTLDVRPCPNLEDAFANGTVQEIDDDGLGIKYYAYSHGDNELLLDWEIEVVTTLPVITRQPTSVTSTVGSTATFSVTATGDNLSYQWQFCAPGTSAWNDSSMTGATTATLSVPVTAARSGQQYRCIVTNPSGSDTSNAAKLLVKPKITTQPKSVTANAGDTVQFTVAASGGNLTYQWQFKAPGTTTWNDSGMTGAKTATLKVEATSARNGQQYRCVVKNANGTATSNAATLTVSASAKPSITTQPQNKTAAAGTTVKFTVEASGSGLSYQWQFKAPGTTTWNNSSMTGAKTATLSVEATTARNGQQYRCIVKNSAGSVTSNAAKLTVVTKPSITAQPKNITAVPGDVVKFTVSATGGGLSYQWQYKSPSSSTWKDSGMTGAKTATLTVTAESARNGQQYRCVVKNAAGTATSNAGKLTVSASAKPTIMIDPKSVTASAGSTVKFTVEASGGSGLKYQWQFKAPGTDTWYDSSMTGAKTATLTVTATAARSGQQYRCIVTNSHGSATSAAAKLTVK